tara:strand:- start:996 stop:1826 length:831 start_codon:yes stop_codon:yes gene_type:complete
MLIIKDIHNLKLYLDAYEKKGFSMGYVPTMGSLHVGHGELIRKSKEDNQKTIISIFVNEKQFDNPDDYKNYPRNRGKDYDFCDKYDVDIIFEPSNEEIYKEKQMMLINKNFQNILCDKFRPGHFNGVITALEKLFLITKAKRVYFGEKDYQQFKIVQSFAQSAFKNLSIISVPTVRQEEGIAFSSRNENLSKKQLQEFVKFHNNTCLFISEIDQNTDIADANILARDFIKAQNVDRFDYFEFRNSNNLSSEGTISDARLFYAIYKGEVRLIDNLVT